MSTAINHTMNRRKFLLGSAAAATVGIARGQGLDPEKMKRIAVMSLSLASILKSERNPTGAVDVMDYPEAVADHLGVHNLELDARTFFASWEPAYITDFRARLKKSNSQVSQIIMSLGTLTPTAAELQARFDGIDHAVALACPRVMVLTGNALAPDTRQAGIDALKSMADYAKPKGVSITMENFNIYSKDGFGGRGGAAGASGPNAGGAAVGGRTPAGQAVAPGTGGGEAGAAGGSGRGGGGVAYSAPWDVLLEVCKASGTYINPDTGNFFDNTERMKGLPIMYTQTAGSGHVKYAPTLYDTGECIRISKRAGYEGIYSIEANGGGRGGGVVTDQYAASINIRDIILANM
jgi:hypothetical protein